MQPLFVHHPRVVLQLHIHLLSVTRSRFHVQSPIISRPAFCWHEGDITVLTCKLLVRNLPREQSPQKDTASAAAAVVARAETTAAAAVVARAETTAATIAAPGRGTISE